MGQKSLCWAPVQRSGGEGTRAGRGPGAPSSVLWARRRTEVSLLLQMPFPALCRLRAWRERAVSSRELGGGHGWGAHSICLGHWTLVPHVLRLPCWPVEPLIWLSSGPTKPRWASPASGRSAAALPLPSFQAQLKGLLQQHLLHATLCAAGPHGRRAAGWPGREEHFQVGPGWAAKRTGGACVSGGTVGRGLAGVGGLPRGLPGSFLGRDRSLQLVLVCRRKVQGASLCGGHTEPLPGLVLLKQMVLASSCMLVAQPRWERKRLSSCNWQSMATGG